jgi:hypothetical protein
MLPAPCQAVEVCPPVELAFMYQSFLNKIVKVGIQLSVMDVPLIVVFQFVFDFQSIWVIKSADEDQQVALEASQIMHTIAYLYLHKIILESRTPPGCASAGFLYHLLNCREVKP